MTLTTGMHGGSGASLHFTPGNIRGQRVETKYCELCIRVYIRPVSGVATRATCPYCEQRNKERLAKEARETRWARSLGQPQKKMPEVSDGVSRHRAGSESAVSPGAR